MQQDLTLLSTAATWLYSFNLHGEYAKRSKIDPYLTQDVELRGIPVEPPLPTDVGDPNIVASTLCTALYTKSQRRVSKDFFGFAEPHLLAVPNSSSSINHQSLTCTALTFTQSRKFIYCRRVLKIKLGP